VPLLARGAGDGVGLFARQHVQEFGV
jgi:hypothetical protein